MINRLKGRFKMEEKKFIRNSQNEKICVEVFVPETVKETIIFCHGITGCRKGRTMDDNYFQVLARKLMSYNYKVVLFDFSGHGESEGNDYDVSLLKSTEELRYVVQNEVLDFNKVKFLAFSYGAAVLGNLLSDDMPINPSKIVLYSPCFYPLESCFLSTKSIFGKDIVESVNNGEMEKKGYAVVGAKNFKFGNQMLTECKTYSPDIYIKLKEKILVLGGRQDVILETKYNDDFCVKNNIMIEYFDTSHSLFEEIGEVFDETIAFFEK